MVKVFDPGVQAQEFLSAFSSFEALLILLLTPRGTVRLFNQIVAACRGNNLLVVDVDQTGELPDRSSVTSQLIGMNDAWNIVFTQESDQENLCGVGVAVTLEKDALNEAVLVRCTP